MPSAKKRQGQAMVLTVLMLGGVILGATTIAGTLMLYQLRATTDSENSAKSVFAADAGTQLSLFSFYCDDTAPPRCGNLDKTPLTFSNGASVDLTCYDASNTSTDCSDSSSSYAIAIGSAGGSSRAFSVTFSTGTVP